MVLAIGIVSVAFHFKNGKADEPIITNRTVTQVAVIVKDIDKAREAWAEVLGVETS